MKEGIFLLKGFHALATLWYVEVFEDVSDSRQKELQEQLEKNIVDFENKYSRFKKDSLLSVLNSTRSVPYDKDLAAMLTLARGATKMTDGIFDIFIHDKLVEKGYGTLEFAQSSQEDESFFTITDTTITLTGNKSIDLGGIGKGYLIDCVKDFLHKEAKIEAFLINGGGDIYVTHCDNHPVEVFLQHPIERELSLGSLFLKNKGFCSSSSYVRTWNKAGEQKNHFITKDGKEVWAASFVVGESAAGADIMATVLCITSLDEQLSYKLADKASVSFQTYDEKFHGFGTLTVVG